MDKAKHVANNIYLIVMGCFRCNMNYDWGITYYFDGIAYTQGPSQQNESHRLANDNPRHP